MRILLRFLSLLWLALLPAWAVAESPVATVPSLSLERYAGRWYELARLPMFFQRHCLADTTAQYSLEADGRVAVFNRCRTASGWSEIHGHARVVANSGNARLKVTFFWPFSADYWVIGLDPDYRWAVVGTPNREYLWILSRTPTLPAEQLQAARATALAQGYDLTKLLDTPQHPDGTP